MDILPSMTTLTWPGATNPFGSAGPTPAATGTTHLANGLAVEDAFMQKEMSHLMNVMEALDADLPESARLRLLQEIEDFKNTTGFLRNVSSKLANVLEQLSRGNN